MHIGIDVGGTNTDAVLMDGRTVRAATKQATSPDVTAGVVEALRVLLAGSGVGTDDIAAVAIGTTHFTNAVIERRGLAPTAAIRLGMPAAAGVPPMAGWPKDLRMALGDRAYMCRGGHEFDGRRISDLEPDELKRIAQDLASNDITSVAVTSVFSPATAEMELEAAQILTSELPQLRVSLSHEIGRLGLLERENATIINAALLSIADRVTSAFQQALASTSIDSLLYLSQNDGTLMDVDFVRRYPVATFAAGPTNSMRGAALLTGLKDCIVVDVGGTTTDVGAVTRGFPRPATTAVDIGGVRTNFRMPDVVSIGIGGGSVVSFDPTVAVGPESVGYRLREESRVFGGRSLTATDIAVAGGLADLGDPEAVADLDPRQVSAALAQVSRRVGDLANTMRTTPEPVPLVLVGGGSILLLDEVPGFETVIRPDDYAVANAIGAAIAQVSGEVDHIYAGDTKDRTSMLREAQDEAVARAVTAGADPATVAVVEVDELPIAYLPGDAVRVRVKAVGDLMLDGGRRWS
ncbi:hydantoinase/oxoprolinase family protein [Kribbella sancticallisti]|uniref:Hydantoinase/oxoprolinase family protein n=1 Tax=Kribbella sancticallisti TaxID=460087 RepID=A0ABN2C8G4_9ACTN